MKLKAKGCILLSFIMTLLLIGSCKKSDEEPDKFQKEKIIGNWTLTTWQRTDDNPNPDGEIFGVYCDGVYFYSNDSVKFYFRNDLLVGKGTWLLQKTDELILITLESGDSFSWKILDLNNDNLQLKEETSVLSTNEQVTILYTLNK